MAHPKQSKYSYIRVAMVFIVFFLATCAHVPSGYNTTGSKGQLTRQEVGFDGNICHYDNGMIVRTQGNCPATSTSNVYRQ